MNGFTLIRKTLLAALLAVISYSYSQVSYEVLNYSIRSSNEWNVLDRNDSIRDQGFRPNLSADIHGARPPYNLYAPINEKDSAFLMNRKYKERSWFHRKLLKEHFIIIDTGLLYITIDPLFNFSGGQNEYLHSTGTTTTPEKSKTISTNTRGLWLKGDIGKKLSFESYFYENQSTLPQYINDFVKEYDVVPGQGRVKDFKESGFDYAQSGGYVSYSPWQRFNLQFGHHKHFVGDGYRSLMLSDNSFNYPFLRMNLWLLKNRISYSVLYASFQNLNRLSTPAGSESPFERKGGTFHNIDFRVNDWLKFNVFQGMIWKTMDTSGQREINYNMFNPIAFVNPIQYGLDDENNAIMGLGFKAGGGRLPALYGQFVVDDNDFNQYGLQLGSYYFLFSNLRLQLEMNHVKPYTYAYLSNNRQSYTHYNQALSHPVGTGFTELLFKVNYRLQRFLVDFQYQFVDFSNEGQNIFQSNHLNIQVPGNSNPNQSNYGIRGWQSMVTLELAYLINPATNAKVFFNINHRNEIYSETQLDGGITNNFFYFGLRTDLRNLYYDF